MPRNENSPYHSSLDHYNFCKPDDLYSALQTLHRMSCRPPHIESNEKWQSLIESLSERGSQNITTILNVLRTAHGLERLKITELMKLLQTRYQPLESEEEQEMMSIYENIFPQECFSQATVRVLIAAVLGVPLSKVRYLSYGGNKWTYSVYLERAKRFVVRYWKGGFNGAYMQDRIDPTLPVRSEAHAGEIVGPWLGHICRDLPFLPMDMSEYIVTEWESGPLITEQEAQEWEPKLQAAKKSNPILMSRGDDWGFALREKEGQKSVMPVTLDFSPINYVPNVEARGENLAEVASRARPIPIPIDECPVRLVNYLLKTNALN